jgi:hypothetical protein
MSTLNTKDGVSTQTLNLGEGGQQGAMVAPHQWLSSAPHVRQPLVAVLVAAPGLMEFATDKAAQIASLKALIELMPQTIEGLNATVTWEFSENLVGKSGEMLEAPINSLRERSVPVFTWPEKFGYAIAKYWRKFGQDYVRHPDLGRPAIISEQAYIDAGSPAILPDMQSFSVLFFEPNESMTAVTNAWLCTNMMPKTSGEIIGRKAMGEANEVPEQSVEFTALTMVGKAVDSQAQLYLDSINLNDLDPSRLKPFSEGIDPGVVAAEEGYASKVSSVVDAL